MLDSNFRETAESFQCEARKRGIFLSHRYRQKPSDVHPAVNIIKKQSQISNAVKLFRQVSRELHANTLICKQPKGILTPKPVKNKKCANGCDTIRPSVTNRPHTPCSTNCNASCKTSCNNPCGSQSPCGRMLKPEIGTPHVRCCLCSNPIKPAVNFDHPELKRHCCIKQFIENTSKKRPCCSRCTNNPTLRGDLLETDSCGNVLIRWEDQQTAQQQHTKLASATDSVGMMPARTRRICCKKNDNQIDDNDDNSIIIDPYKFSEIQIRIKCHLNNSPDKRNRNPKSITLNGCRYVC